MKSHPENLSIKPSGHKPLRRPLHKAPGYNEPMNSGAEQKFPEHFFRGLDNTFLKGQLILGGSSGLFGFETAVSAWTEDLDFYVDEELVVSRGAEIVRLLGQMGYGRFTNSPTFSAPGLPTFDLVGYSTTNTSDHLSLPGPLQVMVFGDLGLILARPGSVAGAATGRTTLSPAGFVAVKLTTIRVEKGSKDKIQALLVIAERAGDSAFRETLRDILKAFDDDTRADALSDAQMAFLALRDDPTFQNHGAAKYIALVEQVESGFQALRDMLGEFPDA